MRECLAADLAPVIEGYISADLIEAGAISASPVAVVLIHRLALPGFATWISMRRAGLDFEGRSDPRHIDRGRPVLVI
jgi:hypothetical protein